jgi:hypothetical protein
MLFRRFLILAAGPALLAACASSPEKPVADYSVQPGYHVVGNQVLDKNGAPHFFHGVDRPSLEFSSSGENISAGDFRLMAGWKANVVRIALNQDYWLEGGGASYQQTVLQAVEWAKQAGMDVILDLHWSDKGQLGSSSIGQQKMADANSILFWQGVAAAYKQDGRVLFELYNEPHDITWDVWLNGGNAGDFTAAGMQQLYDAVRSTGAQNIVIAGGLNWAYDLSGVATHPIQGQGIMYATHPYDQNNWKPPSSWDANWGYLTATYPVIITEFGSFDCSTSYASQLIDYADAHGASWTAWAWYVSGCDFPSLITDWAGTPSPPGQAVKDALARYVTQGEPTYVDASATAQPDAGVAVQLDGGASEAKAIDSLTAIDAATSEGGGNVD